MICRIFLFIVVVASSVLAQDITTLEQIGPVVRYEKAAQSVTLHCSDNSQVRLTILAPDLIRVERLSPNLSPPKIIRGPSLKTTGKQRAGTSTKHPTR